MMTVLWLVLGGYVGWRIAWGIIGMLVRRDLVTIHKDRIEDWKESRDGWT